MKQLRSRSEAPPSTSARKQFGKYHDEKSTEVRKADVNDEVVTKLLSVWRLCRDLMKYQFEMKDGLYDEELEDRHGTAYVLKRAMESTVLKTLDYSAHDVEKACIALAGMTETGGSEDFTTPMAAGLFLSTIINSCKDTKFRLNLTDFPYLIDYLGTENTKEIEIFGDVGENLGDMQSGLIVVNGNAGAPVGPLMEGGKILVTGNVYLQSDSSDVLACAAGAGMQGGEIIIEGDTEAPVGNKMHSGTIWVNGAPPEIEESPNGPMGGTILFRDEIIFQKGDY